MRSFVWIFLICLVGSSSFAQRGVYLPVDSSGYFRLITLDGQPIGHWVALDDVRYNDDLTHLFARSGNKWGVVNDSLQFIIQPKYDTLYTHEGDLFAESLLHLDVYRQDKLLRSIDDFERIEFYDPDNRRDFVSKHYHLIYTLNGVFAADDSYTLNPALKFDDAFYMDELIYTRNGNRFGFIGVSNTVVKPVYKSIAEFNHAVLELVDEQDHKLYFLTDGKQLPDTDSTLQYHVGHGLYKIYKNGKGYLYDENLKSVVSYSGDDVFYISNPEFHLSLKYVAVQRYAFKSGGKMGVCDQHGNILVKPQYQYISYVNENRYIVMQDTLFGVITRTGEWIVKPIYTYIDNPHKSYFQVYNRAKKGVLDENGKIIVPVEFEEIYASASGIVTLKNGKKGFYRFTGDKILNNEWDQVFKLEQNSFEFVKTNNLRCVVNDHGLQTPQNCSNVYVGPTTLKYYRDSIIVTMAFTNGVKDADSVIYENKTRVVVNRDQPRSALVMNESSCASLRNQLTGKMGAKNKEDIGFSVLAVYDNQFDELFGFIKTNGIHDFSIEGMTFTTKEIMYSYQGGNCASTKPYYAYLETQSPNMSHTSELDPVYSVNERFKYTNNSYAEPAGVVAMKARKGFTCISLTSGSLNFESGQPFTDYKDYFSQLNSYHNLVIDDKETFSLLSLSPMIYAQDAEWHVIQINDYASHFSKGYFEYYQQLGTGTAVYSKDSTTYGIYFMGVDNVSEDEFAQVIPVSDTYYQFFYTRKTNADSSAVTTPQWTVYSNIGQYLNGYYDSVELIHSGFFIVSSNGCRYITNRTGKVIYELPQ